MINIEKPVAEFFDTDIVLFHVTQEDGSMKLKVLCVISLIFLFTTSKFCSEGWG